jgi:hypothetical protein
MGAFFAFLARMGRGWQSGMPDFTDGVSERSGFRLEAFGLGRSKFIMAHSNGRQTVLERL